MKNRLHIKYDSPNIDPAKKLEVFKNIKSIDSAIKIVQKRRIKNIIEAKYYNSNDGSITVASKGRLRFVIVPKNAK